MDPKPKRITNSDIGYWMGKVDSRLEELTKDVGEIISHLNKIDTWQLEHNTKGKADNPGKQNDIEERAVTWKWLVVTFIAPLISAILTASALWLLLGK